MANYKELDEALSLVESLATTEQIQNLLRTRKGHKDVRIGAENKSEVVYRNLREAVDKRAIEIEAVFDLIRDSEESGNQHIFYYKPKSRAIADALAFENIAPRLFGSGWEKKLEENFPAIKLRTNDFKTSDFRRLQKKPKDWIFKIYGDTTVEKSTGKEKPEGTNQLWRLYEFEQLRIVLLARWNSPDLLEIRVQRNDSRRRVEGWHNTVWEMLKPHLVRAQFEPWEMSKTMKNLIDKESANEKVYDFRDARLIDKKRVHVTFQAESDTGNLFGSDETRESLHTLLDAKSECDGLTVTWKPQSNEIPKKDLRTLLGVRQTQEMRRSVRQSNEMVVQAHCSDEDLDYVTGQLRQFNK